MILLLASCRPYDEVQDGIDSSGFDHYGTPFAGVPQTEDIIM
jgi:hypothetical protein